MHVEIVRDTSKSSSAGEFAVMLRDGSRACFTCEQPGNENRNDVSSVPEGDYQLLAITSPGKVGLEKGLAATIRSQ